MATLRRDASDDEGSCAESDFTDIEEEEVCRDVSYIQGGLRKSVIAVSDQALADSCCT